MPAIRTQALLIIISVAILVGTEILAAALALGWALGGLMGLGKEIQYALIGLSLALGAYAVLAFVRRAIAVEARGAMGEG